VKGNYAGSVIGDVVKSDGNEKQLHAWQQSESGMAALVWKFTLPDQLILDPFCGAGTTGIVCVHQARRFIGIDIDPVAIATTEERLWTTNL